MTALLLNRLSSLLNLNFSFSLFGFEGKFLIINYGVRDLGTLKSIVLFSSLWLFLVFKGIFLHPSHHS